MAKLTIQEASDHFKVSKEAVHNRIRRGTLASIMEHGVKYVIVDDVKKDVKTSSGNDDKYYSFLEEQNKALQEKVERLEKDNSSLRDQKELMLIEERIKIENIYKEKDEQLKNILNTISTKFLAQTLESDVTNAEIIDIVDEEISLKKYLKSLGLKQKRREVVIERFKKLSGKEKRIIVKDHKLFVNPKKYSYSDII
ncbi:DNA-binding protein [bacterium]|nr:DNA-binding protein [bacterium]MBU1883752.1 DNA-binding protein [bacterium]